VFLGINLKLKTTFLSYSPIWPRYRRFLKKTPSGKADKVLKQENTEANGAAKAN
jgi:hypothetical protein